MQAVNMINKFSKKTATGLLKKRKKFKPISRKLIIYIILASFVPIASISLVVTWFTTNSIKNSYIDELKCPPLSRHEFLIDPNTYSSHYAAICLAR
jgi:hypothetical protein